MGLAELFALIRDHGGVVLAVAFLLWFLLGAVLFFVGQHEKDYPRLMALSERMHQPYTQTMRRVMKGLARLLLPETVEDHPRPAGPFWMRLEWETTPRARARSDLLRLVENPWSWPVMAAAMLVAIVYPLVFAITQWTVTGSATGLGGFPLLPEDVHWAWRYGAMVPLAGALLMRIQASATSRSFFEKLASWLALSAGAGELAAAMEVASAGALEGAAALVTAGALAVAVSGGLTISGGLIISGAVAIVGAAAVIRAVAVPGELTVSVAVIGLLGFASAGALAVTITTLTRRGYGLVSHVQLLLGASVLALALLSWTSIDAADVLALLLTFVLLPSVNAMFDWLSYGFTIWLLQTGHRRGGPWPWIAGLVDIVVAAIMFAALSASLVIILCLINHWRGTVLVDVTAILSDPGAHLWVVAMVASTLLPTMLHLALATLSLLTWVPLPFWERWARRLDGRESFAVSLFSSGVLSATLLVVYGGVLTLIAGSVWTIWRFGGVALSFYVDALLRLAQAFA